MSLYIVDNDANLPVHKGNRYNVVIREIRMQDYQIQSANLDAVVLLQHIPI